MKKTIFALLLFAVALSACATSADRAAYHQAQVAAITMQMEAIGRIKPLLTIEAHEGQEIKMSGVKKLEVYYPITGEAFKEVAQFKDEYIPVYLSAMNLMGIPISIATQGYFFNEAIKSINAGTRETINYGTNNNVQTVGTGAIHSPNAGVAQADHSGSASAVPTNAPITTTTTEVE